MRENKTQNRSFWSQWRNPLLCTACDEWGEVQLNHAILGRELRFDGGALQGRLNLSEPWVPLSEYAVSMSLAPAFLPTFNPLTQGDPCCAQVCLLGVGSGNLAWTYQRALPKADFTLVELRKAVIEVANQGLGLKDLPHSKVLIKPAELALPCFEEAFFNLIAVDLFLSHGMAHPLMTSQFWGELFKCLSPQGVACVNLWSSDQEAFETILEMIRLHCGLARVIFSLSHLSFSNVILFICSPQITLQQVIRRATFLDHHLKSTMAPTRKIRKAQIEAGLSGEPLPDRAARLTLL